MMVIGLNMLGNMNKQATSQASLGLPFWRLLLASGILAIVIGFLNVVAVRTSYLSHEDQSTNWQQSFVFRDKARNVTARRVRSRGAMTLHEDIETASSYDPKHKAFTISTHHTGSSSSRSNMHNSPPPLRMGTPPVDCGSPQLTSPNNSSNNNNKESATPNHLNDFNFSPLRAFRSARQSFLPSYHSTSPTHANANAKPSFFSHRPCSSIYSRTTSGEPQRKRFWQRQREEQEQEAARMPEISYPLNVNPQFAHLVRPNLAHHPSVRRPEVTEWDKI